ncbi:MAG: DUF421 domain-containing protein [Clostridia bacterium]|nr:DUF421 domain-containing protein [Clostridia bacterium]
MTQTFLRTILVYVFVIFSIRIMGKRQIGDMQPGELVITILISDLAAAPIVDPDMPIIIGAIPVLTLVVLEFVISKIVLKSIFVRRLMNGHSAIIIRDGKIEQQLLKKLRISVDDLMELLRGENVFDISDVAYGILETNGSMSVMLKSKQQNATKGDVGASLQHAALPIPVITDGVLRKEELEFTHLTNEKLNSILEKEKLKIDDVFLLTVDQNGETALVKRDKKR